MTSQVFWVFNAGSSNIKFSIFSGESSKGRPQRLYHGSFPHEEGLAQIRDGMSASLKKHPPVAAGHRVVQGGMFYSAPAWIDPSVLDRLEKLVPLAPLHQPHSLRVIRALSVLLPGLPQMACFDTAFHRTQPRVAEIFALPRELSEEGIRRYGFHGISYEYITAVLPDYIKEAPRRKRVIVAHLGNGASLCAIRDGRAMATTMGFTPLDGLVMGTRCGSLDPGVILYLLTQRGMKPEEVTDLLYHRSGLLGVSGLSHDMSELLANSLPEAAEAIDLFIYRVVREMGSMAAALGGLDALVFTAGIGEKAPSIRQRISEASEWLGIRLDPQANQKGGPRISREESPVSAWVIPTDEEWMIARHMEDLWEG